MTRRQKLWFAFALSMVAWCAACTVQGIVTNTAWYAAGESALLVIWCRNAWKHWLDCHRRPRLVTEWTLASADADLIKSFADTVATERVVKR